MEVFTSLASRMSQENVLGSIYKRKIINSLYSLIMQVVSLLNVSKKPLDIEIYHQSNSSPSCVAQPPVGAFSSFPPSCFL